jgi:plastocyanin domain-containing protein
MDKVIVTVIGFVAIVLVYWFFLMRKTKKIIIQDEVTILVDGGYNPEVIQVPVHKKTIIHFLRKDPSDCLEEVVLSDFKIRKHLPLNKEVTISITPEKPGEYVFSCGMNMFHGKIIVES